MCVACRMCVISTYAHESVSAAIDVCAFLHIHVFHYLAPPCSVKATTSMKIAKPQVHGEMVHGSLHFTPEK